MAFAAKDGKKFGNRQKQKAYDEAKAPAKDESNTPTAEPEDSGDIQSFVAANGPADEVTMKHDDDSGEHEVVSSHRGKKHKSKHASRDEAHMHAAQAAGLQPRQDSQPMQQPMGIPGL
jgi:hypothetical protein